MKKSIKFGLILITVFLIIICYTTLKPRYYNVLIITCDALRMDHLSCYGYRRATTPNIDKLAKEGILFTQAISQALWTVPSLTSINTSTYVHTHGFIKWTGDSCLNPSVTTLAKVLKYKGYSTGFITGHGNLSSLKKNSGLTTFVDVPMKANQVTRRAIEWLKNRKNRPFFLHLHYMEPHVPYNPPSPYDRMFLNDGLGIYHKQVPIKLIPPTHRKGNATDLDYFVSQYDGEIRFADEEIGKLLKGLKRLNLYDNTIIIFSADHGEYFGEHGLYFIHGGFPFEPAIRVPLIIKYNNIPHKTIHQQVQHIDIMPTVLDLLHIKTPSTIEGKSLLPLIKREEYHSPYTFSEIYFEIPSMVYCIRTERWKLIYIPGDIDEMIKKREDWALEEHLDLYHILDLYHMWHTFFNEVKPAKYMLYDLKNDPEERHNLAATESDTLEFLRAELNIWLNQASPKSKFMEQVINQEREREKIERLRSLGYIQ